MEGFVWICRLFLEHKILFYGHQVFPIGLGMNVLLPFLTFVFLSRLKVSLEEHNFIRFVVWGTLFILWLPNSTYLFLEVKHLLFKDSIVDGWEPLGVLVFVFLSFLGLSLTVYTIWKATSGIGMLREHQMFSVIMLCVLSSFGATLGLRDIHSVTPFVVPTQVIKYTLDILSSPGRVMFIALLGMFMAMITIWTKKLAAKW